MDISFKDVTLSYGFSPIVEHFSFEVGTGQHACLQGVSGSGKTTILRTVMGFVAPESGRVKVGEWALSPENRHQIRQQITWLPQNITMPADTGQDMIKLLMPNLDHGALKDTLHHYLDALQLKPRLLNKDRLELSLGQKQRLVFAILLLFKRPILLLDEPTSALDEGNAKRLANLVFSLPDRTVLTSSHSPAWIERCSPVIPLQAQ